MPENAAARGDVISAYARVIEDLFEKFDRIKDRHDLSDSEILGIVEMWTGFDIADAYREWIDESE